MKNMGEKNIRSKYLLLLLCCNLLLKVAGLQDLEVDVDHSRFGSSTQWQPRGVKRMPNKRSAEFDTVTFTLVESDTPILVTEALGENVKNNLSEWLFQSTKFKHFNMISSFVHFERSNEHAQFCNARDELCHSNAREKSDDVNEINAYEIPELDDELQNNCAPVSFSPTWPPPNRSGAGGWMSLWVYWSQLAGPCAGCCAARMPVSHTIGEKIEVPELMKDFDLPLLDWQSSYLLYLHASTIFEASTDRKPAAARALCVLEGSGTVLVHSPTVGSLSTSGAQQEHGMKSFSGSFEELDCILVPKSWELEVTSTTQTSLLMLSWQDDVTLSEEFIQSVLAEEGSDIRHGQERGVPALLSRYMPPAQRTAPTVWLDQPKLPYLFSRFLFSKQLDLGLEAFVDLIKLDANVFPSLIDCPPKSECFYLLREIFTELDFNGDGFLNESDLLFLTPATYEHISNELDDLIQEVIDVATDQWEEALEARTSTKAAQWAEFASRAQEKRRQTAVKTAQRIAKGDLSFEEIATIKESLPGLYEELVENGNIEPVE